MVKLGDWLSEGWGLVSEDLGTWIVAALLTLLIGTVSLGICMPALHVGLFMMAFAKMRGEEISAGDVFQGFSKFGPAFVAALLAAIVVFVAALVLQIIPIVGQIASALLGIVVGAGLFYTFQLIAETDIGAVDALKESFEKVKPDFLMYCVTSFVYGLINSVGAGLCGIGALFTMPLVVGAMAMAYRDNFELEGVAAAPAPEAGPAAPAAPEPSKAEGSSAPEAPAAPEPPGEEDTETPDESGWEDTAEESESEESSEEGEDSDWS